MYAESIPRRVWKLTTYVEFIDGTKIRIAGPSGQVHQRAFYGGDKRIHRLSYQTVTTPDALIFHLYGPVQREDNLMPSCTVHQDWMQQYITV